MKRRSTSLIFTHLRFAALLPWDMASRGRYKKKKQSHRSLRRRVPHIAGRMRE